MARFCSQFSGAQGATCSSVLQGHLLDLYCSNHGLCFRCFIPLRLYGADAAALPADDGFMLLCARSGVELGPTKRAPRALVHTRCALRLTRARREARLALGQRLLATVALLDAHGGA